MRMVLLGNPNKNNKKQKHFWGERGFLKKLI